VAHAHDGNQEEVEEQVDDTPTANGHDAVALYDKLEQVILPLW